MIFNDLLYRRGVRSAVFATLAFLGACAHERVLAAGRSYTLQVMAGDAQFAPAGSMLPSPLVVEVRDVAGVPVKAAVVVYRVTTGAADGAALKDTIAVTDGDGLAAAELRLGARAGAVEVRAYPLGSTDRGVTLRATATAGPALSGVLPVNVGPGDTLALAGSALGGLEATVEIGGVRVRPVSGGTGELRAVVPDCLPAGATSVRVLYGTAWTAAKQVTYTPRRRPIALRPFEATVIGAGELAGCATLAAEEGAEFLVIPQFAAQAASVTSQLVRLTVGGATVGGATVGGATVGGAIVAAAPGRARSLLADAPPLGGQSLLDARLREAERRLAPLARATPLQRPPMFALTSGSLRTFHVITGMDGDTFTPATGRLRFVGEHLGIYVDTAAASAYSDADLERVGRLFDRDLYQIGLAMFGPESDIDHNGKVLVFLTPRVNALVKAGDCGQKGFVTGFFYGRDLLPTAANSNAGEIFYALVPDPDARYSCAHAADDVVRLVSSALVHEMQHMISFFHHVVARGGDPEVPWIGEGLSHIAEEAVSRLFERRYPAPLGRSTLEQLFPDSASPFIAPQMLNAYVYLYSSAAHSVTTFNGTGSLEERGAAWLFLRWLGDQKGESIYRSLVQTSLTGLANVEAQAAEPFARLFGDFTLAIWGDSIPGRPRDTVAPRYRFLSRNLRQLMAREATIAQWPDVFPITPVRVPYGGYAEGTLMPGTMVYTVFGPLGAGQGSVLLGYARSGGAAFGAGEGAQVGILRVSR